MILTAFIHFKGLYVHETNWSKQSSKNPNDSASNENSSNNFTTMLNCFVDLYGVSVTFAPKSLLSHCVRVCGWTLATHTLGLVHIDSVFKRFLAVFRCLPQYDIDVIFSQLFCFGIFVFSIWTEIRMSFWFFPLTFFLQFQYLICVTVYLSELTIRRFACVRVLCVHLCVVLSDEAA